MINDREITPELLARVGALVFTRVPFEKVLEEQISPTRRRFSFDEITKATLADLMMEEPYFYEAYSRLECESYAQCVIDYVAEQISRKKGGENLRTLAWGETKLDAFALLIVLIKELLKIKNDRAECRYSEIQSWRILTRHLGEELPLCIRYAVEDYERGQTERRRYGWSYVTPHNNAQLNAIMQRGISEHHYHMWGSTPYFHLSWINLMNQLNNSVYAKNLKKVLPDDQERKGKAGWITQIRAAWIRLYLCECLTDCPGIKREQENEKLCKALEVVQLEDICCLNQWRTLVPKQKKIQSILDYYRRGYGRVENDPLDYALHLFSHHTEIGHEEYEALVGERALLYNLFIDYCKPSPKRRLSYCALNLFFAYFLMRIQIRNQMVQANDWRGFDNFQAIQDRKDYFTQEAGTEKYLAELAIKGVFEHHNVQELEIRTSPRTAQIQWLQKIVKRCNLPREDMCYYVVHFIKKGERFRTFGTGKTDQRLLYFHSISRDQPLREKILRQTKEIIRFRETNPSAAEKLLGIDAASQEIGCRPEVFGTVFRTLAKSDKRYGGYGEEEKWLPHLRKTYHVGEDFLDVVDGLRAIDEAIRFLQLDCGDRLGHAIALGVDVKDWYESKHYTISLPVQDYLDNLAWLYHSLMHFSVLGIEGLKERIKADFDYWFRHVYSNFISDWQVDRIMRNAVNTYQKTHEDGGRYTLKKQLTFDIMDYYRAWSLRGDDPSCYADGYFKNPDSAYDFIPVEACKVNHTFPVHYEDRYVAEHSILNYYYYFDGNVRKEGEQQIKVNITKEYVQAVKAIQGEMRSFVARRGISIETNPTSNVLIGTFRKYEKHPILNFYNRGLPVEEEEERDCAQLQVSINTDDAGVFYTSLEMEYALLASSVEQLKGADDKPRFKKQDVYTWIDHIRVMGNEQSFQNHLEKVAVPEKTDWLEEQINEIESRRRSRG